MLSAWMSCVGGASDKKRYFDAEGNART